MVFDMDETLMRGQKYIFDDESYDCKILVEVPEGCNFYVSFQVIPIIQFFSLLYFSTFFKRLKHFKFKISYMLNIDLI